MAGADRPATEAQRRYLRQLVLEADGEVDEDWLAALTMEQASQEIERYGGRRREAWPRPNRGGRGRA